MAAAMNGMALHGGIIPYSGTFLVFSDYCRPAIRLAALMGERVIHVMTHDSIGLGEDGPTHQPVEHLAALARDPQSAGVPPVRRGGDRRVLAARARSEKSPERAGADAAEPAAAQPEFPRQQPLRRRRLRDRRRRRQGARCRSSPPARKSRSRSRRKSCWPRAASRRASCRCPASNCSLEAPEAARRAVIGDAPVKIGVEAAVRQGWDAIIGSDGVFVGMTRFRRQRALQGPLQAFRHYRRKRSPRRRCASLGKVDLGQYASWSISAMTG